MKISNNYLNDLKNNTDLIIDKISKKNNSIVMIKVSDKNLDLLNLLKSLNFNLIEKVALLEYHLEKSKNQFIKNPKIQLASKKHADECAEIAGISFKYDRFHKDPNINNKHASNIKSEWMRNNIEGRTNFNLIFKSDNKIVGINTCDLREDYILIDLICVHPNYRGFGIGKALVKQLFFYLNDRLRKVKVGTQVKNKRSLTLYKDLQFKECEFYFTLHKHIINENISY